MPTTTELRATRANRIEQCHALVNKAEAEQRELTAEERQQYDRLWDEQGRLKAQVEEAEGDLRRKAQAAAAVAELRESAGRRYAPEPPGSAPAYGHDGASLQPYSFAMPRRPGVGPITLGVGTPAWHRHQPAYRDAFRVYLRTGHVSASLQTDVPTQGGYLVVPEQMVAELLMDVDDQRWIRRLARKFTTTAQTLGVVKRTAKMASFAWGAELTDAESVKDTTLAFGKRSLTPHYMVGMILISRDLMRSAVMDPDQIVRYEIARDSGELEEKAFLTGDGSQKPLGLFTASADGIDTGRDVASGSTTAITADLLRDGKYGLKPQYRADPSTGWLFHRDAMKQISKLKDGDGQYLWQSGLERGDPDRLVTFPVYESEFAPNTFTTGKYVGLLGAFNYYWIADSLEMDLQVLVEKYATTNQIAYIARRKTDAMPQLAEAFVRLKLA